MRLRWLSTAAFFLVAAMNIGYGCGGSSSVQTMNSPPPIVSPSPTSASLTIPLAANTALPMPPFAGFSGTFTEFNAVAAGTTVLLTTQITPPVGAPAPLTALRKRLPTVSKTLAATASTGTPIVWVGQVYSASVLFNAAPVTTWQLPPSLNTGGPFELETFDGTTGTLVDIELAASADSSNLVSFTGSSAPLAIVAGHKYWWELITNFPQPTGSPSPAATNCAQNNVTATLNSAGQTLSLPDTCGFSGAANVSSNNAASGVSITLGLIVPALSDSNAPPLKPGTTTGIFTIAASVNQTVAFGSGMLQFAIVLPSTVSTAGKTFFLSACTSRTRVTGCIDNPFITGPLTVSGQTVSYAGLPFNLTLSGPTGCGPRKICTYTYHASVEY